MRLDPSVVLMTSEEPSRAAVMLRRGGYLVTKMKPAGETADAVARLRPDAVVVDLPLFAAIDVLQTIGVVAAGCPRLAVTDMPRWVATSAPGVRAVGRGEIETGLVSAIDRLLIDAA